MNSLIRNEVHLKQIVDFTGLQNRKIYPSDIDSVLEFDNKFLILMEFKKDNANIPLGQELLLQRICNSWEKSDTDKQCVILKISHSFTDTIYAKDCNVTKIYKDKKWFTTNMNLKDCLIKLGIKWNCQKLKNIEV